MSVEEGTPKGPSRPFAGLAANAEMCDSCSKRVYTPERLSTGKSVYHKACFRCTHCKRTLSLSQYTCDDNKPYCKPHYQQLFKIGGNYNFNKVRIDGTPANSTPSVVRQTSSETAKAYRANVVRSPSLLSPTSPVSSGLVTYRSPSLSEANAGSDSVGNVKRLPTFAATRAMFENASFGTPTKSSGTPSVKPVTPSVSVREMKAKREGPCSPPEIKTPPPVYSPSKENESPPVERYNDAAELEKEQKIDDEKNRQEEQQVYSPSKENESPPVERYNDAAELEKEQKIDDEKNRQEEQQIISPPTENESPPATRYSDGVDEQEQMIDDEEDRHEEQQVAEQQVEKQVEEQKAEEQEVEQPGKEEEEVEEKEHNLLNFDEDVDDNRNKEKEHDLLNFDNDVDENRNEVQLVKIQLAETADSQSDDDVARPNDDDDDDDEVEEREPGVIHKDHDLDENHDEDEPEKERPTATAGVHKDDNVGIGDDDDYDDAAAAVDVHGDKYSDKSKEDNDVPAQQQQQKNGVREDNEFV